MISFHLHFAHSEFEDIFLVVLDTAPANDISSRQDISAFFGQCMPDGSIVQKLKAFNGYVKLMQQAQQDMLEQGQVIGVFV
jgi:hypothetical protein